MSAPDYIPEKQDFTGINLNKSLHGLREELAEAVHDAYVQARLNAGWNWGPSRDDQLKTNPTLIPYNQLPESEKEYDRLTADTTLKAILARGYEIIDPEVDQKIRDATGEELQHEFEQSLPTLRLIHRLWKQQHKWTPHLPLSRALASQALDQGELPLTFEIARDALESHPHDPKITHILALALVQDGHPDQASAVLRPLLLKGNLKKLSPYERMELLGAEGRLHKESWLLTGNPRDLRKAIQSYERAHAANPEDAFPLINQASLTLLAGRRSDARKLARQAIRLLPKPTSFWDLATVAEAELVLGNIDNARSTYARAMKTKPAWREAARSRQQCRLIAESAYSQPNALDQAFKELPCILIYAGHMTDECHPGRHQARFPEKQEPVLRPRIQRALKQLRPAITYGSAACGSDILILEESNEETERNIILPGPVDQFTRTSVGPGGKHWLPRFKRQLEDAAAAPIQLNRNDPGANSIAYGYGNEVIIGLAQIRARRLGLDVQALAVWDRQPGWGTGGTGDFVARCHHNQIPVRIINPGGRAPSRQTASAPPPPLSGTQTGSGQQVLKAILMADVKAFSTLHENQIVPFQNQFMRLISSLIDEGQQTPASVNTWGDALYMIFNTVSDAARFALLMRDTLTAFNWSSVGLPPELSIRTALHAGPVFAIIDPITRFYSFTGNHVTYAARMEPVTEPGQIFVSESFAALLETSAPDKEFRTTYVGRKQSAKGYGEMILYRLDRAPHLS